MGGVKISKKSKKYKGLVKNNLLEKTLKIDVGARGSDK